MSLKGHGAKSSPPWRSMPGPIRERAFAFPICFRWQIYVVDRVELERLVALGYTQREVAQALGCSQTTVRYWLHRWGLKTRPTLTAASGRAARQAGLGEMERDCKIHGPSRFVLDVQGYYRCTKCRADRVADRRRRVKEILVAEAGGRCIICGYDRHPAALEF